MGGPGVPCSSVLGLMAGLCVLYPSLAQQCAAPTTGLLLQLWERADLCS